MKIMIVYFFKNVVLGFHLYLKCFLFNSKTSLYASKRKLGIHKHQDLSISVVRKEKYSSKQHLSCTYGVFMSVLS